MWDFMFCGRGLEIWLGKLDGKLKANEAYRTNIGITGSVRVFKAYSHIRMDWKKKDWSNTSTVQVRVIKKNDKTIISFHQEKLANAEQRLEMKAYWNEKMDEITKEIEKSSG